MAVLLCSSVWIFFLCTGAAAEVRNLNTECHGTTSPAECTQTQDYGIAASLVQQKQHRSRHLPDQTAAISIAEIPDPMLMLQSKRPVEMLQAEAPGHMNVVPPALANIPEKLMELMVLGGDPYPCDLAVPQDARFWYCGSPSGCYSLCGKNHALGQGLHPTKISKTAPWKGSLRMLSPIGSLPCCSTPPHCMAPTCRSPPSVGKAGLTCTKNSAMQNVAYLTHPQLVLAYKGFGGSHDLDVQKHWDILGHIFGCYNPSSGTCLGKGSAEPFDMSLDLGSDHGSVTENLLARKFAKDYVLLDAWPAQHFTLQMCGPMKYPNWKIHF